MNAVSNSGPIIHFSWLNRFDILTSLFDQVVVPDAVVRELVHLPEVRGSTAIRKALGDGTLTHLPDVGAADIAAAWPALGRGEAEALALARDPSYDIVLLDDRRARQAAARLNLHLIGTVGLLVRARELQIIPAAAPLLGSLLTMGFYIDASILQQVRAVEG